MYSLNDKTAASKIHSQKFNCILQKKSTASPWSKSIDPAETRTRNLWHTFFAHSSELCGAKVRIPSAQRFATTTTTTTTTTMRMSKH